VLIQTNSPEHYAIRFASEQITTGSMRRRSSSQLMRYPPFSALANVLVRSQKQEDALQMSTELGRLLDPAPEGLKVLGGEAPVPKLKTEFRYQLLLKAVDRKRLNATLGSCSSSRRSRSGTDGLLIDVDPLTLL